ncbi:MAG: DNA repair protein RecN [Candidatus Obscuribacterales bacterium]
MLKSIQIRDFALIEKTQVDWTAGLNVLTGETGAGKSILMDALNAVLGGKVPASIIRPGADKANLEAVFVPSSQVIAWLKKEELIDEESAEQAELTVAREIGKSGSKIRINGTLVNHNLLGELRTMLITVHAQHEARTLMSSQSQLELLDGLGSDSHTKILEKVRTLYARKKQLQDELDSLTMSEDERLRKLDFSKFQLNELEQAELSDPSEDEELARQVSVLSNAIELKQQAEAAQDVLTGSDSDSSVCAVDLIQKAMSEVEKALRFDSSLDTIHEALSGGLASLEEASTALRRYADKLDTDPDTLIDLENRANLIATIKRKYGPLLSDAMAKQEELSHELEKLENGLKESEGLAQEIADVTSEVQTKAAELSKGRLKLAKTLSSAVEKELVDLGMEKCRFEIAFNQLSDAGPNGIDKIDFLIAPNPGQPAMPLGKIASGGELSRIMLAIKTIFAAADQVATVIFDEIDTGLSGRVLNAVRDKLSKLSRSQQILCITHQPIVASVADNYLEVKKEHLADRTIVTVNILDDEMRLRSLAAMASGNANEEASLSFARSLIDQAAAVRALP